MYLLNAENVQRFVTASVRAALPAAFESDSNGICDGYSVERPTIDCSRNEAPTEPSRLNAVSRRLAGVPPAAMPTRLTFGAYVGCS